MYWVSSALKGILFGVLLDYETPLLVIYEALHRINVVEDVLGLGCTQPFT